MFKLYTIILVAILIFLSIFIRNIYGKCLITFSLITIMAYWISRNFYHAVSFAFIISLLLCMKDTPNYRESFENEGLKDTDVNVNKLVKELTNLTDANVNNVNNVGKGAITEDDLNLFEESKEDDGIPDENNKYMQSTKAQKETFRLINTIQQLNDAVNQLAPTLQQGAGIIEKFKKLNLIKS